MPGTKPFSFEPMLCVAAEQPPEGPEWRYELKLDGFRAIGRTSGRSAQLLSRNQKDFVRRFPGVVKAIRELPDDTVIDVEIVALDAEGRPSFNLLQGFDPPAETVMCAFDLLMLRGKDTRLWLLDDRRAELLEITGHLSDNVRFSETFNVPLTDLVRAVRQNQLEGIVAKRAGALGIHPTIAADLVAVGAGVFALEPIALLDQAERDLVDGVASAGGKKQGGRTRVVPVHRSDWPGHGQARRCRI